MSAPSDKKPRTMPKGGRKGGSIFPRVSLTDVIGYAKKLVSKTHTAPQPQDVLYSGVVGAKSGTGAVRVSALKQFGFLVGDVKAGFAAAELAKQLVAAPAEEILPLYRAAALKPTVFKKLFDTFHGDSVSKAKLKQRAADLKVHPDETGTCVELYITAMSTAQLVAIDGDMVQHVAAKDVSSSASEASAVEPQPQDDTENENASVLPDTAGDVVEEEMDDTDLVHAREAGQENLGKGNLGPGPRAVFNVNVTLDSSLDTEKLQKQLELLKRFGAI